MCVCVCVCVSELLSVYVCILLGCGLLIIHRRNADDVAYVSAREAILSSMYVCMYMYGKFVFIYACMYVCLYICMFVVCMYVCIYVYMFV